jgi:hypothetical protein
MENNRRLYVLIDKSLEPVYGCVQGGHAVAQWLLEHPKQKWDNSYLIYLYANLNLYKMKLIMNGKDFSEFREPDLNYKTTAIACEDSGKMFKNLHTVKVR